MARVKECFEVNINGEHTLIQVIRTEKKEERNVDGTLNIAKWSEIINNIMKQYLNTNDWTFLMNEEVKTINIRLKV